MMMMTPHRVSTEAGLAGEVGTGIGAEREEELGETGRQVRIEQIMHPLGYHYLVLLNFKNKTG
jgi:hypothetical protein